MLYNVPSRTGCDLLAETAAAIGRRAPNVVAIKEAGGSLERGKELIESSGLAVLSGEDHLIGPLMALGAAGAIGVVANLAPREVAELCRTAAPGGDAARAKELEAWLAPLVRACFVESNPTPMKAALAALGHGTGEVRLPLAPLAEASREAVIAALDGAGLLSGIRPGRAE